MAIDLTLERWMPFRAAESAADWEALYEEQLPRIYNYFRYRVGHGAEAEDLTSLTFEKAWQARDRFDRKRGGFGTWLLAIARNVAVDHYRAARNRPTAPLEEAEALPGGPTPEELFARRSDAERLARLLDELPAEERELMALKYGSGLSHKDISKLTGLSTTNIATRVHRIVARLRTDWHRNGGSP